MRETGVLIAVALSALGQNSKPSPIGRTRTETAAIASARAATERHAEPEATSERKQDSAGQNLRTADTGPACFYRQKAVTSVEQELGETPPLNASHPTLPLGTRVKVTNLANKLAVVVTISEHSTGTDYIICVNYAAAEKLGLVRSGVAQVRLEKL